MERKVHTSQAAKYEHKKYSAFIRLNSRVIQSRHIARINIQDLNHSIGARDSNGTFVRASSSWQLRVRSLINLGMEKRSFTIQVGVLSSKNASIGRNVKIQYVYNLINAELPVHHAKREVVS